MDTTAKLNKLKVEYQLSTSQSQTNPHGKIMDNVDGYNFPAHKFTEANRYQMDSLLAQIVELVPDKINFLSVKREKGICIMCFDPFANYHEELARVKNIQIITVDANGEQKGGKLYRTFSKDLLVWKYKIIKGNVSELFKSMLLAKYIKGGAYKMKMEDFCKDAARIIRYYPNVDHPYYSTYISAFIKWLANFEKCPITMGTILTEIYKKLKTVFYKDKQATYEQEGTLNKMIGNETTVLEIKHVSKKAHNLYSKVNIEAMDANNYLMDILKAQQMAQDAINKEADGDDDDGGGDGENNSQEPESKSQPEPESENGTDKKGSRKRKQPEPDEEGISKPDRENVKRPKLETNKGDNVSNDHTDP